MNTGEKRTKNLHRPSRIRNETRSKSEEQRYDYRAIPPLGSAPERACAVVSAIPPGERRRERTPESLTGFKAIRAKFQEEIAKNQGRNKPTVPDKPKQVPPAGPPSSLLSAVNVISDNRPAVMPCVVFKDPKTGPAFKRPISQPLPLPPCTPPLFTGDENARCSFRDKRLSLVLPVQPKQHKPQQPVSFSGFSQSDMPQKEAFPFKLASPEPMKENAFTTLADNPVGENFGEESMVAPLQLYSNTESPSQSPDALATLSLAEEARSGSLWNIAMPCNFNTLQTSEREHVPSSLLLSTSSKSKSAAYEEQHPAVHANKLSSKCSPTDDKMKEEFLQKSSSDLKSTSVSALAAKINGSTHRKIIETLEEIMGSGAKVLQPRFQTETLPPKVPLPSLQSLGPKLQKPPRPPFVDLSSYWTTMAKAHGERGLIGAPQNLAAEHPQLQSAEPMVGDLRNSEFPDTSASDLNATEIKGLYPGHQPLSSVEPEAQEPKVSILQALGLWSRALDSEVAEFIEPGASASEASQIPCPAPVTESLANREPKQPARLNYDTTDNLYEDVENVRKLHRGHHTWKRKSIPKNPYADSQNEDGRKSAWFHNPWFGMTGELHSLSYSHGDGHGRKVSPEDHEDKELKKREKHRLEREKKEQKEREKKEQEMKKKFKITGEEEPMYQAKVTVASKGRKGDLPVQTGDVVSIIRTTDCPKGKWLARDSNNRYGYVPVMNVELDIKEMLELGKKASQAACRGTMEGDYVSDGSRSSNQWPVLTSSFTDSEEWTCDDEESVSSPSDARGHIQTLLMPETSFTNGNAQLAFSDISSEDSSMLARHEALQKLASFFEQQQETGDTTENEDINLKTEEQFEFFCSVEEQMCLQQEDDFQVSDLMILPPPEPYADRG
ncbi:uncharacterized protein LOC108934962 isoform X2 [Scleropages formosus]|uniref:uncharacterized protein LOC108934962 isoform X2 n=1 Tax=Scleropages formosus TaxID=113540 RepID=UPI0010FA8380|nr:uncharacterized protein LOC108934962 isoform X2 [Scleropages formosus]